LNLENLVDKEAYRIVYGYGKSDIICKPNIVYLDAETNRFLEAVYEPRGIKNDQVTHHYKHNGTLYCWYQRTRAEKGVGK